jgi:hypothetical protein
VVACDEGEFLAAEGVEAVAVEVPAVERGVAGGPFGDLGVDEVVDGGGDGDDDGLRRRGGGWACPFIVLTAGGCRDDTCRRGEVCRPVPRGREMLGKLTIHKASLFS